MGSVSSTRNRNTSRSLAYRVVESFVTSTNGLCVIVFQSSTPGTFHRVSVARDLHHGGDELVVPDAAVIRAGHGAKLDAAVIGFQCFHKLGAMRKQAVLQIDPGQQRGKLPQIE